jgi:hypothetical protein
VRRTIAALAAWLLGANFANAQEAFTLTGLGGRQPPLELALPQGATFTPCKSGSPGMIRCLLIDTARAGDITADLGRQLAQRGWAPATPAPTAVAGLLLFTSVQATGTCPPVVMIVPGGEAKFATEPVPSAKAFHMISYAPDLMCMMQAGK